MENDVAHDGIVAQKSSTNVKCATNLSHICYYLNYLIMFNEKKDLMKMLN
ncbi:MULTISPECIES: hypothetical protein [Methanosphaera]|nr:MULTISPECIES: hypothetical protein [Methanosphaera]